MRPVLPVTQRAAPADGCAEIGKGHGFLRTWISSATDFFVTYFLFSGQQGLEFARPAGALTFV
jgi:hypothetical protein